MSAIVVPIVKYSYIDSHHWNLDKPSDVGNYTRLILSTPSSGTPVRLEPGRVNYIRTGIRINPMASGYRFRIENSPIVKEAPFYILEYSNYEIDELYVKIISMRNIELDYRRVIAQIVVEANPIILHQTVISSYTGASSTTVISGAGASSAGGTASSTVREPTTMFSSDSDSD
jgi:hypothetical protein